MNPHPRQQPSRRRRTAAPACLAPLALVAAVLLGGCAGSSAASSAPASSATHAVDQATSQATGQGASGQPPETASMVCGDEVKEDAARALGTDDPPTDSTWDGRDYTCTYHLPDGPMTLTVHVAADDAAARTRYEQGRAGLPGVQDMAGLGEAAYGNGDGLVVVRKDAFVLQVDTTALPPVFGANGQRRSALASEMASVILGCWTQG